MINEFEDPPIVGDWKGRDTSPPANSMSVELEGDGDASMPVGFVGDATIYTVRYDLEWEQTDESRYKVNLDCKGSNHPEGRCSSPFRLRCVINDDGDELACADKTGVWDPPKLYWELD